MSRPSAPKSRVRPTAGLGRVAAIRVLLALVLLRAVAASAAQALPALGADETQTSVSGLSSGAFMAVQLQVAYSKDIVGAGVVAGGPYYCAADNIIYTGICMGQVPFVPPNASLMVTAAKGFAKARSIDGLSNLAKRRIYVFSGTDDSIVRQQAVDATVQFFKQAGVPAINLQYVNTVPAGHAMITPDFGNGCGANAAPHISHCNVEGQGYDQAGALLQRIYGPLKPRSEKATGQVIAFDQRPFAKSMPGALADTGFVYVPQACSVANAHCRIHIAIHGCGQSAQSVDQRFVTETGYNAWADTNQLLILYPQVDKSDIPSNPAGCWDWWGYTGSSYATKGSIQMKAIVAMAKRLGQSN